MVPAAIEVIVTVIGLLHISFHVATLRRYFRSIHCTTTILEENASPVSSCATSLVLVEAPSCLTYP
jgi:hypothetical protein